MMEALSRKRDFLSLSRNGVKHVAPAFVLLARKRDQEEGADTVRVGYAVTRKLGKAVIRNRIKRRLRDVIRRRLAPGHHIGYDFLFIARQRAQKCRFTHLERDMDKIFARVLARQGAKKNTEKSARRPRRPQSSTAKR